MTSRTVLVTGATGGIGQSICKYFYQRRWNVIGVGKSVNPDMPFCTEYYSIDFSKSFDVNILPKKIDSIVNNAGINILSDIQNVEYQNTMKINLEAPLRIIQHCIPNMIENKFGRIVNVCSIWSKQSKPNRTSYTMSKFGLDGLTCSLIDYSKDNVLVNSVSPGFVDTELTRNNLGKDIEKIKETIPIKRLALPDEISKIIYWLCNDNSYIAGQNISIDGGYGRGR